MKRQINCVPSVPAGEIVNVIAIGKIHTTTKKQKQKQNIIFTIQFYIRALMAKNLVQFPNIVFGQKCLII